MPLKSHIADDGEATQDPCSEHRLVVDALSSDAASLTELECPTIRPGISCEEEMRSPSGATNGTQLESPPSPAGLGFGDFETLEEIGRGGMGIVYRARQISLDRTVAIKVLVAGQWASAEEIQRLREEATAAARLTHPAIVPIYEVGEHEGRPFLCMAYIRGETLAERIRSGPLPAREAANLVQTVSEAVHYAHGCGVIHRDLKPANILLDTAGRPHVTDFGLAKRLEAHRELTDHGQVLGTPGYIPPEQAAGRLAQIDVRSDVYALGAVLYSLLTGRPPFSAATSLDTLLQVLERDPVPPRQLNAAVPRDLETIALKCLEKDPRRRYSTAAELADDLRRYLSDEPIRARPLRGLPWAWRWCRKNLLVASVSGVLALVITAVAGLAAVAYYREVNRRLGLEDELAKLQETIDVSTNELRQERRWRASAEQQAATAGASRLVAEFQRVRADSRVTSLLLAIEAVDMFRRGGLPVPSAAIENLAAAVEDNTPGETIRTDSSGATQDGDATPVPSITPGGTKLARSAQPSPGLFPARDGTEERNVVPRPQSDHDLDELLNKARHLAGRTLTDDERRAYSITGNHKPGR